MISRNWWKKSLNLKQNFDDKMSELSQNWKNNKEVKEALELNKKRTFWLHNDSCGIK